MGGAYVRNWGIALQDISQAQDFVNQPIQVTPTCLSDTA
jgi:hypothetical protein